MKKINIYSLNVKLTAGIISLLVLGMVILQFLVTSGMEKNTIDLTESRLTSEAEVLGNLIDRYINERVIESSLIANDHTIKNPLASNEERKEALSTFKKTFGNIYLDIFMVDKEGDLIASSSDDFRENYSDTNWFIQTMGKKGVHYEIRKSTDLDIYLMVFTNVVTGRNGEVLGVINARMPLNIMDEVFLGHMKRLDDGGFRGNLVYIVNDEGIVIWHPGELVGENLGIREDGLGETVRSMMRGNKGTGRYVFGGNRRLTAYAPLIGYERYEGLGWAVGIAIDEDILLEPVADLTRFLRYGVIVFVLLISLIIRFIIGASLKPLKNTTAF